MIARGRRRDRRALHVSLTAEFESTDEPAASRSAKNVYELIAHAPGDESLLEKGSNHWAEIESGKVTYRIVGRR